MAAILIRRSTGSFITRLSGRHISTLVHVLKHQDQVTHTGQQWTSDDYRNVRFIDRKKQVNSQFAINLLAEEPVEVVNSTDTWCDGGGDSLGHPKVYINLDKPEICVCGYCGKNFVSSKNEHLFSDKALKPE